MHRFLFIVFFALMCSSAPGAETLSHQQTLTQVVPATGKLLHGVFPGGKSGDEDDITPEDVDTYEKAVGKRVSWIMFSHNWFAGRKFPIQMASWIRARKAVPYIRLMLRSDTVEDHREPHFTLKKIAGGKFDRNLKSWGKAAAGFSTPIIVEFGTEMNGRWFPWNAVWNGKRKGAHRFVKAYRHIIDVVRSTGASNIIWVFHINNDDDPDRKWNRFENYYPGDDYIDWLAISIYSAQSPFDDYLIDFTKALPRLMKRFAKLAPDKPVIIAEFGSDVHHKKENAANWADAAMKMILSGRWPQLIGFNWWNETWPNGDNPNRATDLRVQSSPTLAKVMKNHLEKAARSKKLFCPLCNN